MNKITKLGVSALCGSLAAVSAANAGEMTVTGGVDMSWVSLDDEVTGNPIGMGSNLTFTGSGDLDNGWSVALSVAMTNADAYSNTNVTVTVPTLGAIRIDQGTSGTGIDRIDDVTPSVWEEAYGAGLGAGIQTVSGGSAASTIEYTPNMLPDGATLNLAYTPDANGSNAADKGSSGHSAGVKKSGWDAAVTLTDALHGMAGLTLYGGIGSIEQDTNSAAIDGDKDETTIAVAYAAGGFTVGYQWSEQDLGTNTAAQEYTNEGYGVTFNVNDDLSIGYNHYESDQDNATDVTAKASSFQIAYSMGGASIRLYEGDVDNNAYQTGAAYDRSATVISVSLAF
jgi:outer membrane protein OmpU